MSQTVTDYATGTPLYRILGGGGGGDSATAESMTTLERMAITPDAGFLIWDTDLEKLFVGDGSTAGGVEVQGGESYVAGDGIEISGNTISATGGGGEGTVTGIEASVSDNTATITATGSTTSVDIVGKGGVNVKGNTNGEVELDTKGLSDGAHSVSKELLNAREVDNTTDHGVPLSTPLTLIHISDIHGDSTSLERIVADADELGTVADVVCTGDIVRVDSTESVSWWNPRVLIGIGNHDVSQFDQANWKFNWPVLTMAERAAKYIEPFESNWGITHTPGTSYYYKDYSASKVRLIMIDTMLYDPTTTSEAATQTSWLESLLADAITNELHVLIGIHSPRDGATPLGTSFNRYNATAVGQSTSCPFPHAVSDAVASAITGGLHFIGYIAGHQHQDNIYDATGNGTQFIYNVACAAQTVNVLNAPQWSWSDQYRDASMDAYNLITIDTYKTLVKIVRGGGANIDYVGRKRDTICINYSTGEIYDYQRPKVADSIPDSFAGFGLNVSAGKLNADRYTALEDVSGASVTVLAGHGYSISPSGSTFTLNAEQLPQNTFGRDGHVEIVLTGVSVSTGANVVLVDTLTDNAINYCTVKFYSNKAWFSVDSVVPLSGYMVTVTTGTDTGSLYYGLATSTENDISFSPAVANSACDLGGAIVNNSKNIIGNGAQTIVSGGISCAYDTVASNLSMDGVSVLGGTLSLVDVTIPNGGTCYTSGTGQFVISSLNGPGTVNYTNYSATSSLAPLNMASGGYVSGVTFTGTFDHVQKTFFCNNATIESCLFSSCVSPTGDAAVAHSDGTVTISGCTFSNVSATAAGAAGGAYHGFGSATGCVVVDCLFTKNYATTQGGAISINTNGHSGFVLSNCSFTSNTCGVYGGAIIIFGQGYGKLQNCTFANNFSKAVAIDGSNTKIEITGCSFGANQYLAGNLNGTFVFSEENTIFGCQPSTNVKFAISSGASIALVYGLYPKESDGITVSSGGCVVNGATIAAGTYTRIVSSGGSAVAS